MPGVQEVPGTGLGKVAATFGATLVPPTQQMFTWSLKSLAPQRSSGGLHSQVEGGSRGTQTSLCEAVA